jgi:hypothetical protein
MTKRALLAVAGVFAFCALPVCGDDSPEKPGGHGLRLATPTVGAPSGERAERDDGPAREKRAQINAEEIWFASRHSLRPADGIDPEVRLPLRGVYVAQFRGPILKEWREALEAAGARILDYVQNYAYVIEVPEASSSGVAALAKSGLLRYLGPYPAEAKISWGLQQAAKSRPAEEDIEITVRFFDVPTKARKEAVSGILAVTKWEDDPVMPFARGAVKPGRLRQIAELPFVKWVEEYVPGELHNIEGSMSGGADWVVGWGTYDGTGVRVAVNDSGITQPGTKQQCGVEGADWHPDINFIRIADQWDFVKGDSNACDDDGHGTHTAGSIGGDGTNTSDWTGIAPGVTYLIYKDCCKAGAGFGNFTDVLIRAASNDANVVANSWGSGNNDYNWMSEAADNAVRGEWNGSDATPQYMNVTVSSGNDNDLCTHPATGKNVIAVGAMRDGNWPYEGGDYCWCTNNGSCGHVGCFPGQSCGPDNYWPPTDRICFSNYGPVNTDGGVNYRIKPDVMAPGTRITSTAAVHMEAPGDLVDGFYVTYDGTSMSQPMVAGTVALMLEANPGFVDWPEAIKARLLATAVDLGNTDLYGHGMVDALHAVNDSSSLDTALWEGSYINTGEEDDYEFAVPTGYEEVRVYLTWSDPPSPGVVNNLDLRVYDDTAALVGSSLSLGDTVEYVRLTSGVAGSWSAEVKGENVPQPGPSGQKYGVIAVVVLNAPSRSLSASASAACLQPDQTFTIDTTHSNGGYSVVGSQIQLDMPDDTSLFLLLDVDMATEDPGRGHTYLESELWRVVASNSYYLATGIVNQDVSRSATWNLQVDSGTADGTYNFDVYASAAAGESTLSKTVAVTVDSTEPGDVIALDSTSHTIGTCSSDMSVTMTWTAAPDGAGCGIDGYGVWWSMNAHGLPSETKDIEEVTTYTEALAPSASPYYFNIRSVDNAGNWASGYAWWGPFYLNVAPTPTIGETCGEPNSVLDAGAGYQSYSWSTGDTTQTISEPCGTKASYTVTVQDSIGCYGTSPSYTVCACPGELPDEPSATDLWPVPPLKVINTGSQIDVEDTGAPFYVIHWDGLEDYYTPTRNGCTVDSGLGAEPGTVRLDWAVPPGDVWIAVAAANGMGESSAGRDSAVIERKAMGSWTEGPCPP